MTVVSSPVTAVLSPWRGVCVDCALTALTAFVWCTPIASRCRDIVMRTWDYQSSHRDLFRYDHSDLDSTLPLSLSSSPFPTLIDHTSSLVCRPGTSSEPPPRVTRALSNLALSSPGALLPTPTPPPPPSTTPAGVAMASLFTHKQQHPLSSSSSLHPAS